MENNETQPNTTPVSPTPNVPQEGQEVKPNRSDTEVNPSEVGNNTEVDLDKQKINTYPKSTPPERH